MEKALTEILVDGSIVSHRPNGQGVWQLACSCAKFRLHRPGDLPWCQHVGIAVEEGKDVWSVEATDDDYDDDRASYGTRPVLHPLRGTVEVVVEHHPGVAITVNLVPVDEDSDAGWLNCFVKTEHDPFHDTGAPFAVIGKGDGRNVIREAFLDFVAEGKFGSLRCTAISHPGDSLINFTTRVYANPIDKLADIADLLTYQMCRNCREELVPAPSARLKPAWQR